MDFSNKSNVLENKSVYAQTRILIKQLFTYLQLPNLLFIYTNLIIY